MTGSKSGNNLYPNPPPTASAITSNSTLSKCFIVISPFLKFRFVSLFSASSISLCYISHSIKVYYPYLTAILLLGHNFVGIEKSKINGIPFFTPKSVLSPCSSSRQLRRLRIMKESRMDSNTINFLFRSPLRFLQQFQCYCLLQNLIHITLHISIRLPLLHCGEFIHIEIVMFKNPLHCPLLPGDSSLDRFLIQ